MDNLSTFTSTGIKLLHHPRVIHKIQRYKEGTPVSLQIAPTSRCQLNCSFCSNVNREKHEDLDYPSLMEVILKLKVKDLKTVEITGGGDPTMYHSINSLIHECDMLGLQIGMITNGVQLQEKVTRDNINRLHWVRISMNWADYMDEIDLPDISGTLGFSYVMNKNTTHKSLTTLRCYVEKHKPAYVRIVPDCQVSDKEQEENNKKYSELIKAWGKPFFYQPKVFAHPERCYWGYLKPFILHNSFVYPCSSVVLNESAEKCFHDKFQWVKMQDLPALYDKHMESFDTKDCNHCVFASQNALVDSLLNPSGMENFI